MNKLLRFFDNHVLKIGVAFALFFIALYPKLPSIQVSHTWVYIRLEDFLIALLVGIWFVQLLRKKITLPFPLAAPIVLYWVIGFISLVFSLIFIAPHLANFFPKIAALQYFRRIEYMMLFFVAFSTVRTKKDIRDYLVTLSVTVFLVSLYGFGQRFYIPLSHMFPAFYNLLGKNPYLYCFPAFLTGNEEFAKGTPFCLDQTSRITSTFGGHYDLAAYLVFVIPVLIGIFLVAKNGVPKILSGVLAILAIFLINFTSSRVSFFSYVIGVMSMLIFWKRKKWIVPVFLVSILVLISFNGSTLQRILKTIQPVQVLTVNPAATNLPPNLQKIITKAKQVEEDQTPEKPPPGNFTTAPQSVPTTNGGAITAVVTDSELKKLQTDNKNIDISTVSGTFLIQKAYALDISFTTRFQAEWPRDWKAFLSSPLFGTGYSSLTLASDNDYLRALGETGLLGFLSFLLIFIVFGIYTKKQMSFVTDDLTRAITFGLAGGSVGLLTNAVMIDVFEASKVAEPFWILLGIAVGGLALHKGKATDYMSELYAFFTSKILIACYLLIATGVIFIDSISNFFTADDFTWLRWAASSTGHGVLKYFVDSGGFFYRPLDKIIMYILYTLFSFQPHGYHLFILFLHFLVAVGVYWLFVILFKKKLPAFLAAIFFIVLPAHAENVYWLATISTTLSSLFILYAVIAWINFRKSSVFSYVVSLTFTLLALFSYEMAVITPLLFIITDFVLLKPKKSAKMFLSYLPLVVILVVYAVLRYIAKTVSLGGDYAYSVIHFIPNFFGNILGYFGIFLTGEYFLPIYTILRSDLKSYAIPIGIVFLVLSVLFLFFVRKQKVILMKEQNQYIALYGLLFGIVSLLPFIGLGNITERYLYLASIGFILFFFGIGNSIYSMYAKHTKMPAIIITSSVAVVLVSWYAFASRQEAMQWQHAGVVTKNTLVVLRTNYDGITPDVTMYFVNIPIRQANAWIFPVGLPDAIWFIYRDAMPKVYQVKTILEAKDLRKASQNKTYILSFDKNNDLEETK